MLGRKRYRCDEDAMDTSSRSCRSTSSSRDDSSCGSRNRAESYYYSHNSRDRSRNYAHSSSSSRDTHNYHQCSSKSEREKYNSNRTREGRDNRNNSNNRTKSYFSPLRYDRQRSRRSYSRHSRERDGCDNAKHEDRRDDDSRRCDCNDRDRSERRHDDKARKSHGRYCNSSNSNDDDCGYYSSSSSSSSYSSGSESSSDAQSDSNSNSSYSDSEDDSSSSSSDSDDDDDDSGSKSEFAWELDQGFSDEVWYSERPNKDAVQQLQICSIPDEKCIPLLTEKYLDTVKGCTSIIKNCFQGVRISGYKGRYGEQGGVVDAWHFDDILGLGHGSTVLAGSVAMRRSSDKIESEEMAFKLVLKSTKASRIAGVEAPLLRKLNGCGFPKLFFRLSRRMRHSKYRVVVLAVDRHGTSLDQSAGQIELKEALMVGIHLVQALRRLHGLGWAHLSIKPENICWGLKNGTDDHSTCVLLDLERAERIGHKISETTKGLAPFCGRTGVFQALRLYSSPLVLPTHDLESVYYIMMSLLLSPKLSQWTDYVNNSISRNAEIESKKRNELESGYFPHARKRFGKAAEPLKLYLQSVRECEPTLPDYDFLLATLSRGLQA